MIDALHFRLDWLHGLIIRYFDVYEIGGEVVHLIGTTRDRIRNHPQPSEGPSPTRIFLGDRGRPRYLQSIYVTRDRVILKFEARVQIYVAVLNICCEIQNSGRNVVRFSKINSYEISFWLVSFKNMRNIRFLGV